MWVKKIYIMQGKIVLVVKVKYLSPWKKHKCYILKTWAVMPRKICNHVCLYLTHNLRKDVFKRWPCIAWTIKSPVDFSNHFFNDPSCYNCYTAPLLMSFSDVITNAISRVKETSRQVSTVNDKAAMVEKKASKSWNWCHSTFCAVNRSCRGWPVWFGCNKHWVELAACSMVALFLQFACFLRTVYLWVSVEMYKCRGTRLTRFWDIVEWWWQ